MKSTPPVILNEVKDPTSFPPAAIRLDSSAPPQNARYRGCVLMFVPGLLAFCSLLLAPCSATATEPADLGQGLSYLRVHDVAAVVKAVATPAALVLDLRHAVADDAATAALGAALAARPADAPLFILVNPATPAALAPMITKSPAVTLGITGSRPAPEVVVGTDAAADRQAYDAFENGTALDLLISGKVEKERFDEAALMEEFKHGNPDAAPSPVPDPTAPETDATKHAPLVDRVLQRAMHLHRALLALKVR